MVKTTSLITPDYGNILDGDPKGFVVQSFTRGLS